VITKFRQVSRVIHFSVSSRDTLDIEQAFVSTSVIITSSSVPSDLDPTAMRRVVGIISNRYHGSLFSTATFKQQQQNILSSSYSIHHFAVNADIQAETKTLGLFVILP